MDKQPLTQNDLKWLEKSFIDLPTAERFGLFRVTSNSGAELLGRRAKAGEDCSGIVFVNYALGEMSPREYCVRPDNPPMEEKANGELKPTAKYMRPYGKPNVLAFSPGCPTSFLKDAALDIVITEGCKQFLSLDRASWACLPDTAEQPRFLALGVFGTYGFRTKVGKDENKNEIKGLLPDFHSINLENRKVTLLYDADVKTNPKVKQALHAFAKELAERNANVFIASCPSGEGDHAGIDDILGDTAAQKGEEAAVKRCLQILKAAKPFKEEKPTQTEQILNQAQEMELFHAPDGEPYATINFEYHSETHRIHSTTFRDYLSHKHYKETDKVPGNQALQDAIQVLSGKAKFDSEECSVFLRHAAHEDKIYTDLCNDLYQVLEISAGGYRVISAKHCPVKFRRTKGMLALPVPSGKGDLSKLKKYINVDRKSLVLTLAWLVGGFRPGFPFAIASVRGEQGTAKTTFTKLCKKLVDPNQLASRIAPRDERDLAIAANNSYALAFDNLSNIPNWLSDSLCGIATGTGFSTRQLYSNDEEALLLAQCPIILNGIGDFASRPDLIDRSLLIELLPIPEDKRKTELAFWAEFEADQSEIFTGLVKAVCVALANAGNIKLEKLPRMADFASWVTAAEEGLGFEPGEFMRVYLENRESAHSIVLDDAPIFEPLKKVCIKYGDIEIPLKELLEKIENEAEEKIKSSKLFPKNARALRSQIERINPNLRAVGIHIEFQKRTKTGSQISLKYVMTDEEDAANGENVEKGITQEQETQDAVQTEPFGDNLTYDYSDEATIFVDMEI